MTSLLRQMRLFFGAGERLPKTLAKDDRSPAFTNVPRGDNTPRHKKWDPFLEEQAREILLPVAPCLSSLVRVGWNSRMRTTAGVAVALRWEVWLNPALKDISQEEVTKTLLHELAHLVAQHRHGRRRLAPHGGEWRQACRDLGIPGEARTHQLPFEGRRMRRRYLLRCPRCGETHRRVRFPRRRVACLACCRAHHGAIYHESFRFQVSEIVE